MNKTDEVYVTLLKAKEKIILYNKEKVKDKNWQNLYNGIAEQLDDIIADYAMTTKMSTDEILDCLLEVGADQKDSVYNDFYNGLNLEWKP